MALKLVIDGYNFICACAGLAGSHPGAIDLSEERDSLLENLNIYKRLRGAKITVVFDGARSGRLSRNTEKSRNITAIFSGAGEEADTVIKEMAKKGGSLTIVTSDRELGRVCESYGAVIISSGEFYGLLEAALYEEMKGAPEDEDEDGNGRKWGEKKGPARRASRGERKRRAKLKKL